MGAFWQRKTAWRSSVKSTPAVAVAKGHWLSPGNLADTEVLVKAKHELCQTIFEVKLILLCWWYKYSRQQQFIFCRYGDGKSTRKFKGAWKLAELSLASPDLGTDWVLLERVWQKTLTADLLWLWMRCYLHGDSLGESPYGHSVELSVGQVPHVSPHHLSIFVHLQFILHIQVTFRDRERSPRWVCADKKLPPAALHCLSWKRLFTPFKANLNV